MQKWVKVAAFGGASLMLASFASARDPSSTLALLDPIDQARSICSGRIAQITLQHRLLMATVSALPAGAQSSPPPLYADLSAPRALAISANADASRYFDQGLMLSYGFNHAGAVRSFRAAQRLDPDCALCWWGEALALGPNINAPMDDRDRDAALAALTRALALRSRAAPRSRRSSTRCPAATLSMPKPIGRRLTEPTLTRCWS